MIKLLQNAPNPLQTDTIEGFIESVYFKGEINVTITSTWCPVRQTQIPVLITILFNKSKNSYSIHWDHLFTIFGESTESINDFCDKFPGNTSDFSDAIRAAFQQSIQKFLEARFPNEKISKQLMEELYRFCEVHFKRNLNKMASISRAVHPSQKEDFKAKALHLLRPMTFKTFYERVKELNKSFPNLKSWLLWYLQEDRASILFPACKVLTKYDVQKFNSLKKDTNAQEGLGGLLQSLSKYKKMGLYYICNTAFRFISTFDDNLYEAMEGVGCNFGMPTKSERKRGREEQKHYKAPDSAHRIFKRHKTEKTKNDLPIQLRNEKNCCFANSIFQLVIASDPFRNAVLNFPDCEHSIDSCKQPYTLLKKLVVEFESKRKSNHGLTVEKPVIILEILRNLQQHHQDYKLGAQFCPIDFIHYILDNLRNDEFGMNHPVVTQLCTMGVKREKFRCQNCGTHDERNDGPDDTTLFHIPLLHSDKKCTVSDCLRNSFKSEIVCSKEECEQLEFKCGCAQPRVVKRLWMSGLNMEMHNDNHKLLILQIQPFQHPASELDQHDDIKSKLDLGNYGAYDYVSINDRCQPDLTIDLTSYLYCNSLKEEGEGMQVSGHLTGYIAVTQENHPLNNNHFVSITKSRSSDDFIRSDDLYPYDPEILGSNPNDTWNPPYIMFYTVKIHPAQTSSPEFPSTTDIQEMEDSDAESVNSSPLECVYVPKLPKLHGTTENHEMGDSDAESVLLSLTQNCKRSTLSHVDVPAKKSFAATVASDIIGESSDHQVKTISKMRQQKLNFLTNISNRNDNKNMILTKNTSSSTSFHLPFFPKLSEMDIELADHIRNLAGQGKKKDDIFIKYELFNGGPIYKLINNKDGCIDLKQKLLEDDYSAIGILEKKQGSRHSYICIFGWTER